MSMSDRARSGAEHEGEREIPGGAVLRKRNPEDASNANEQRIGPIIVRSNSP
jgi:hypothetical protein